jgi:hypothetical protein
MRVERKAQRGIKRERKKERDAEGVLICNFLMLAESHKSSLAFEQTHIKSESA